MLYNVVCKVYVHITYEHVIIAILAKSLYRQIFSFMKLDNVVEETWAFDMLLNMFKGTLQYEKEI